MNRGWTFCRFDEVVDSCCLALVSGRSSYLVLPRVWADITGQAVERFDFGHGLGSRCRYQGLLGRPARSDEVQPGERGGSDLEQPVPDLRDRFTVCGNLVVLRVEAKYGMCAGLVVKPCRDGAAGRGPHRWTHLA